MKKLVTLLSAVLLLSGVAVAQSVTTPSQSLKLQYKGAQAVGNDIELTVLLTNLSSQEVIVNLVGGLIIGVIRNSMGVPDGYVRLRGV